MCQIKPWMIPLLPPLSSCLSPTHSRVLLIHTMSIVEHIHIVSQDPYIIMGIQRPSRHEIRDLMQYFTLGWEHSRSLDTQQFEDEWSWSHEMCKFSKTAVPWPCCTCYINYQKYQKRKRRRRERERFLISDHIYMLYRSRAYIYYTSTTLLLMVVP